MCDPDQTALGSTKLANISSGSQSIGIRNKFSQAMPDTDKPKSAAPERDIEKPAETKGMASGNSRNQPSVSPKRI